MRHSLMHPVRFVAQFGLALAVLGFTSTPALALLIPTVETVVTSNDGTTAVVDLFFTTPDEGIKSFSVSVAYDGSLSVVDATCEVSSVSGVSGICNQFSGDHPGDSPSFWGSFFGISFSTWGVGGDTLHLGTLTFAMNGGAGGSVTPGVWNTGVDGFFLANDDTTFAGNFIGATIPEPNSGLLLALGLGAIGMWTRSNLRR